MMEMNFNKLLVYLVFKDENSCMVNRGKVFLKVYFNKLLVLSVFVLCSELYEFIMYRVLLLYIMMFFIVKGIVVMIGFV